MRRPAFCWPAIPISRRSPAPRSAGAARDDIAADRRPFLDLVTELDLHLDLGALSVFARWITPAMMPKRFDTWFYVAAAPPDQLALCDGWETVDAEWVEPKEASAPGRGRRAQGDLPDTDEPAAPGRG